MSMSKIEWTDSTWNPISARNLKTAAETMARIGKKAAGRLLDGPRME